ncbi:F-box protein [Camellia lanceoleosa]|uniref:F-box protein n=1 Tax=Camellia lanceoleosa TaxID=1840588 RepID=A0ACC0H736_9ERIC|nr:F-box protein [Camellia lanceoleosa]
MAFNCCCDWSSKLPDELTVEILCRLPEKPLIQFKSVSKAWYLLISDVCVPRISSSAPLSGFLFGLMPRLPFSDYCMEYVPLDCQRTLRDRGRFVESYSKLLPFQPTGSDVLDCCNGLLLILHRSSVPRFSVPRFSVPSQYYVCNPATKQCVAIPVNPNHPDPIYAVLAFNPVESPPNNTNNNNYKIVQFASSASTASVTHPLKLDVFSSVTGKWVNHPVPLLPEPKPYGSKWICRSVYLDGVLYMLSYAEYLLCFDLNADNLNPQAVKLPNKGKALGFGFIGMSKDCFYYSNHVENAILVWSLDHDHQWILKHSICIDDLVRFHHWGILDRYRLSPLLMPCALHPTSEVIFIAIPRLIFSYNLKTNQFNVFYKLQEHRNLIFECLFFPYSRCLVVLNDFTQMNDIPRNKGLEVGVTI